MRHRPERGRAFEWTDTAAGASYGGWPRPAPPAGESPAPPSLCAETHRARNARPLHARGRYTCTVSTFVSIGSSPHARDRRHLDSQYLCLSRFIPACAESTFTIHRPAHGRNAVHPLARAYRHLTTRIHSELTLPRAQCHFQLATEVSRAPPWAVLDEGCRWPDHAVPIWAWPCGGRLREKRKMSTSLGHIGPGNY